MSTGQPAARRAGHRREGLLAERHFAVAAGRDVWAEAHHPPGAAKGVGQLNLSETGRVKLRTTQPLFYDEYRWNRSTGSFILIKEGRARPLRRG